MRNFNNFIINLIVNAPKLSLLIIFYMVLRDVAIFIPYLNLFIKDLESRLVIVWLLALVLYRFSLNAIVVWIMVFLFLSLFGIHSGLIIYASLILLFFRHIKEMK